MTYQNGVMPTNEWFEKIKAYVNFKGKTVLDYGCAEGFMCAYSSEAGAKEVLGVDNQGQFLNENYRNNITFRISDIDFKRNEGYDIKIFSMIIHWIGKEEFINQLIGSKEIVVIFRLPNDGYQIPQNGKWFPTLKELTSTLKGFKLTHNEVLMEQDNNKQIMLAIYEKGL